MKRSLLQRGAAVLLALAIAAPCAVQPAIAQSSPVLTNVIPEAAAVWLTATIRQINQKTREVTLRGPSGATVKVTAGPGVRLNLWKVGDTVNVHYYRSIGFLVQPPSADKGDNGPAAESAAILARPVAAPGGIAVRLTKITGLVVWLDLPANRFDVVNPNGGAVHTIQVSDPDRIAMVQKLKVGDLITAVISESLAVDIVAAH